MEDTVLPSGQMQRGRRLYYLYSGFSSMAFRLVSGNIMTLFALKLGAGIPLVGLLSSFMYLAYVFMLVGRRLVVRWGPVKLMGRFWVIRYIMMIPALFTLLPAVRQNTALTFSLLIVGVFGFQSARGVAITSHKPITGELAGGGERGLFLSRVQLISQIFTIGSGLAMAVVLGKDAPFYVYGLLIAAGILLGLIGSSMIFRLPESGIAGRDFSTNLGKSIRSSLRLSGFRKLLSLQFLKNFTVAMISPFLIVFFKRVYLHPDSHVLIFTVVGGLGTVAMALLAGFMMDRVGAKPLFFAFSAITALILIPVALAPRLATPFLVWAFPCLVFFFYHMGNTGIANCAQNYFFAITPPEERLNLGIIYNLALGISGFLGASVGGVILDWLSHSFPGGGGQTFQVYFGALAIAMFAITFLIYTMPDIGAFSIREVLSIILSPRNLRAISLLRKLDRSKTLGEEQNAIEALGGSKSAITTEGLLQGLNSPSFFLRREALSALRNHPVNGKIRRALLSEVKNHPFTTAYIAAEIIGSKKIKEGARVLRQGLLSSDYFLCGKCMVSLAQLQHHASIPVIKNIVEETLNPRLIIHGAKAFEIYRDSASIPLLIKKMEHKTSPFLRDEIILAITGILGIADWFYPLYTSFLQRSRSGIRELLAVLDENRTNISPMAAQKLGKLVNSITQSKEKFADLACSVLADLKMATDGTDISIHLRQALRNARLIQLERFCFLATGLIVWFAING